ncbi:hypothetical protein FCV38_02925 [Clostridium sporogenes]|nr:hypothetical protein [Clostridium sporogenes]
MNYISAEEFLKQDRTIQNVLSEWWKPKVGDLTQLVEEWDYINDKLYFSPIMMIDEEYLNVFRKTKYEYIPILQIHHLIQFIEDKTNEKFKLDYDVKNGYNICFYNYDDIWTYKHNLLQALWQVVCKIAQEEVNNQKQSIICENEHGLPVVKGGGKTMREIYNEEYR